METNESKQSLKKKEIASNLISLISRSGEKGKKALRHINRKTPNNMKGSSIIDILTSDAFDGEDFQKIIKILK